MAGPGSESVELATSLQKEGSVVQIPPIIFFIGDTVTGSDSRGCDVGKGQRETDRQTHRHHLCPGDALTPSVGQSALVSSLIGIWTKGTAGQTRSSQSGQARELLASPEETGLSTGLLSASLEAGGRCLGGEAWWVPRQVLSSRHIEVACDAVHAGRTGAGWQSQADYSL